MPFLFPASVDRHRSDREEHKCVFNQIRLSHNMPITSLSAGPRLQPVLQVVTVPGGETKEKALEHTFEEDRQCSHFTLFLS